MRADSLAERLTGSDNHGHEAAECPDYPLLQILNRFEPLLPTGENPAGPGSVVSLPVRTGRELPPMCVHKRDGPLNTKSTKHLTPYAPG